MTRKGDLQDPWWAEELRTLRHEQKLTLAEVGERAGITRHYLCSLEHGRHNPTIRTLENLFKALGHTISTVKD
jgi:transcriptional regulator with XRE-family HTH domain